MAERIRTEEVMRADGRMVTRQVIRCECGEEVLCYGFTNTCACGADYNMSGQRLAAREQWGSETGEHWSDCY